MHAAIQEAIEEMQQEIQMALVMGSGYDMEEACAFVESLSPLDLSELHDGSEDDWEAAFIIYRCGGPDRYDY